MKYWMISLLLLLTALCPLSAQNNYSLNSEKVELLRRLSQLSLNDTTRLGIYLRLIDISTGEKVKTYYSDKLMEDAQRLNSLRYQCEVYIKRMSNAYNQYDAEAVNHWMSLLEPIALKEKLYDYYFRGRRCVIDMMMLNGEYEREIKEAQQMLRHAEELNNNIGIVCAYNCLSNAYRVTYQSEKSVEVLEKAYKVALTTDIWLTVEITTSLINSYQSLADYKNWFKWISIMDNFLQAQIDKNPKMDKELQGPKMMTAVSYIVYYTNVKDMKNAGKYIEIAEKYNMDDYSVYSYYHHQARYIYFRYIGMHEQALIETDILANIYKELTPLTYSDIIFLKGSLLKELGRYDEALDIYKQAFAISDSVNIAYLNKQTEQLKKDYNTEQLLLEKEDIKRKIQLLYLALVIIVILTFGIFIAHASKVRVRLKKSEEEMRRMAEEMELANIAKETFLSTISTEISTPLNAVVNGALQLTTDEISDEQERKKISQTLNRTSAELMALINNILNLSRLEAGMMKFKMEEVEIMPFMEEVIARETSKDTIIGSTNSHPNATVKVNIDLARFQEVLNNLFASSQTFDALVEVETKLIEKENRITFRFWYSILASKEQSRDIVIANEINRLTIESFKGRYKVDLDDIYVIISLPTL